MRNWPMVLLGCLIAGVAGYLIYRTSTPPGDAPAHKPAPASAPAKP